MHTLDHCHVNTETPQHRCKFQSYDTTAYHCDRCGESVKSKELVARKRIFSTRDIDYGRARPRGHDNLRRGIDRISDLDFGGRYELGLAMNHIDIPEHLGHTLAQRCHDVVLAGSYGRIIYGRGSRADAILSCRTYYIGNLCGTAESLGGNTAAVKACATEMATLYQGHFLPQRRRPGRGLISARTGTYDNYVWH